MGNENVTETPRNYLTATLTCKCPRCRQGELFVQKNPFQIKDVLKMPKQCPVCGQPTEIEVGFYTGAAYVSYALTIAFSVATFIAWWVLLGIEGNLIWGWVIFNIVGLLVCTPWLMRLSRSLWLSGFVKYDPDWRTNKPDGYERVIEHGMEHNA